MEKKSLVLVCLLFLLLAIEMVVHMEARRRKRFQVIGSCNCFHCELRGFNSGQCNWRRKCRCKKDCESYEKRPSRHFGNEAMPHRHRHHDHSGVGDHYQFHPPDHRGHSGGRVQRQLPPPDDRRHNHLGGGL